jgi:Protein of unknown function (DUF2975)
MGDVMRAMRWSRWDQLSLEGLLWALPALALLQVVVQSVRTVRGDDLSSTGYLPDALVQRAEPVAGTLSGRVVVQDPTAAQYAWSLAPALVLLALAVVVARLLLGVVRSLRDGDPFTSQNARRLGWLSGVVLVGGLSFQFLAGVAHARTIAPLLPDGPTTWALELQLWPVLAAGALLGFLAEVFARGTRLREDVEGLV